MKKNAPLAFKHILPFSLILLLFAIAGCQKFLDEFHDFKDDHTPRLPGNYQQVNLVSNNDEYPADSTDPLLENAWGIAFSPNGIAWVNSEHGGVSAVYNAEGKPVRKSVIVPTAGSRFGGRPTGIVFNGSNSDFILSNNQAARFLFVEVGGTLSGWNGPAGDTALLIKDNSANAVYTGLAVAMDNGSQFLYAANFRQGTIDVFDRTFNQVWDKKFVDPYLPSGYAPFNIHLIGDKLYVAYAKVAANGEEEAGAGNGYVTIFDTNGNLYKRFASRGALNAPWGIAHAPASFFANDTQGQGGILIGNFGNGRINAYSMDGTFLGQLQMNNKPLEIEGLWEITFPPATATSIDPNRLYFAAGPDDEEVGLFGYILKQ